MWITAFLFLWCFHDIRQNSRIHVRQSPRWLQPSDSHVDVQNGVDSTASDGTHATINLTCDFCGSTFDSRNKLFRHVRNDPTCSLLASAGKEIETVRVGLLLLFSYIGGGSGPDLVVAVKDSLEMVVRKNFNETSVNIELLSLTQGSVAKLRHRSLSQEENCAAAGDVLVANFQVPKLMTEAMWERVTQQVRANLNNNLLNLISCKLLESDSKLHDVERSCTQRVYHYLLPLLWLPNGSELTTWWQSSEDAAVSGQILQKKEKPPPSLRRFKQLLRTAESAEVRSGDEGCQHKRVALGRFGALGAKEKRAWHNFADPNLRGDASPNNEPVWRCVDRARVVDFVQTDNGGDVCAVLEFKGDDFLQQQVRRIVGATVAMANEWLPGDFVVNSTRSDIIIGTPLAPPGRLYVAGSRFHFEEMRTLGLSIFECDVGGTTIAPIDQRNGIQWVQNKILNECKKDWVRASERRWLWNLENKVSPKILEQMTSRKDAIVRPPASTLDGNACPNFYQSVLLKLRDIIATERWPETSVARSTVIRNRVERKSRGSFTVVNPKFEHTVEALPLGNIYFPDLVDSVFKLEEDLSEQFRDRVTAGMSESVDMKRPSSSHCAVNCNAQFTPHVDSGTGAGQSLSMIVGLGNYNGGGLYIEGESFDIRYKPIEFDGWNLRHWTASFEGERFSLVWFTPEQKGSRAL